MSITITELSNNIFTITYPTMNDIDVYFKNNTVNITNATNNQIIEFLTTAFNYSDFKHLTIFLTEKLYELDENKENILFETLADLFNITSATIHINNYTDVLYQILSIDLDRINTIINIDSITSTQSEKTIYTEFKKITYNEVIGDIYNDRLHNHFSNKYPNSVLKFNTYLHYLNIILNLDLSNKTFIDKDFSDYSIYSANISGSTFINCNFGNSILNNCDFSNTIFDNCDFTSVDIRGSTLLNVDLSNSDLTSINATNILELFTSDRLPSTHVYDGSLNMIKKNNSNIDKKGQAASKAVDNGISIASVNNINNQAGLTSGIVDDSLQDLIEQELDLASSGSNLRARRHDLLRILLFKIQEDDKSIKMDKEKLKMPDSFKKSQVKVFQDGAIINLKNDNDLFYNYGFYCPLEDGESIRIILRAIDLTILVSRYATINGVPRYSISKFAGEDEMIINNTTSTDFIRNQYFVDTEVCVVNNLDLFFGGVGESENTTGADGFGDPYIFPIFGNPTKLPDENAIYRMVGGRDLYLNASVFMLEDEKIENMKEWFKNKSGFSAETLGLITNGYFFKEYWVFCDNNSLYIDIAKGILTVKNNNGFFSIKKGKHNYIEKKSYIKGDTFSCYFINFYSMYHGNVEIRLKIYANPQIDNGIEINIEKCKRMCNGLLLRNYKPQLMKIDSIFTKKSRKIKRRLQKKSQKYAMRELFGKNELVI